MELLIDAVTDDGPDDEDDGADDEDYGADDEDDGADDEDDGPMTRMMALMTRMTAIAGKTSLMTIQKSLMQGLTGCFLAIHKFQIQYVLTKLSLGLSGLQNCFTCFGVSPCELTLLSFDLICSYYNES